MRLHRLLLRLYPASFRDEYGREMEMVLASRRRDASGALAIAALWLDVLSDTLINAVRVHLDILRDDLRYARRAFGRTPGFALTAVTVTALGIGANTAVFSLADRVLIRPLPYPDADRLVMLWEDVPGYSRMDPAPANFRDWRARATSFEAIGAFDSRAVNLTGPGEPARVPSAWVSADVLSILRTAPLVGRSITAEDDREGAPRVVLLSYALWQREFGGNQAAVGATVRLDGEPHVVIGVMPPHFAFPSRETDLWSAIQFTAGDLEERDNNYLRVLGRLKPAVTLDQARAEMRAIGADLQREYPKENADSSVTVVTLRDQVSAESRLMLIALAGAACCVLLIACTNLASVLLARALERRRELTVRTALGAGRERLVRQLLTETLVLAASGGVLGVVIAIAGAPLLERLVPPALALGAATPVDGRVLAFASLLTIACGVAFGVFPALRVCRDTEMLALREGMRAGVHAGTVRLRSILVVSQIVAAVVLLIASGLLMRALLRVQSVDPGFRADGVLAVETPLSTSTYWKTATREALYARILGEVHALPGVQAAAYISHLPMVMPGGVWQVSVNGVSRGDDHRASIRFITPRFFEVMRIPLVGGRMLADSDTADSAPVAVVSESFAQQHWPGEDGVGHRFTMGFGEWTIVGVVGDVRVRGLERVSEPQVYLPHRRMPDGTVLGHIPRELVVRTSVDPASLVPAIRAIVRRADSEVPLARVRTLSDIVTGNTAPRAIQVRVLGVFATLALVLAAVGIYGLLSFSVTQRTREIGVRMALGATRARILGLIGRDAVRLAAIGGAGGLAAGYAAGRAMEALLFGVAPADPITYTSAVSIVVLMTLAGTLVPALRAARVDPTTAMRLE